MPHNTRLPHTSQAKTRRDGFIMPSSGGGSAPLLKNEAEGAPCAAMPLAAGVCPCASASGILKAMRAGVVCPLNRPIGCPAERMAPL